MSTSIIAKVSGSTKYSTGVLSSLLIFEIAHIDKQSATFDYKLTKNATTTLDVLNEIKLYINAKEVASAKISYDESNNALIALTISKSVSNIKVDYAQPTTSKVANAKESSLLNHNRVFRNLKSAQSVFEAYAKHAKLNVKSETEASQLKAQNEKLEAKIKAQEKELEELRAIAKSKLAESA